MVNSGNQGGNDVMSRAGAGENANYICFKTIQTVQPEHPSHEIF